MSKYIFYKAILIILKLNINFRLNLLQTFLSSSTLCSFSTKYRLLFNIFHNIVLDYNTY